VATRPSFRVPIVGDLSRLTRAQRIVGALGIAVLLVIPVAIISLLLSKDPGADNAPMQQVTDTPVLPTQAPASVDPTPSPTSLTPTTGFPSATP
jgi:hypothetical protein